jgi:ABC-2 type transport system permease protein
MLRLIRAEIYKLFKTKKFIVICIVALLLSLSTVGMAKLFSSEDFLRSSLTGMSKQQQDEYIQTLSVPETDQAVKPTSSLGIKISARDILHPKARDVFYNTFGSGVIEILLTILIAGMVAREYSSGTIKNILAYGKKREYYYISKLLAGTIGMAIILALMVLPATVLSSFMFGWGEAFTVTQLAHIVLVFIGTVAVGMGIISVLMLLATLLKSNGSTIGIGIVVMAVLPVIISFLYGRFTWFDRIYDATLSYNWALVTASNSSNDSILKAALVGLITTVIFIAGGTAVFKRQDIK